MGILDDAIREHLDLKRRQGAADDELKRLEDEAFGPPTRPGEPDFPGTQEEGESQASGNGSAEAPAGEDVPGAASADEVASTEDVPAAETVPVEPPPVDEPPPGEEPPPAEEPPPPPTEEPTPVEHEGDVEDDVAPEGQTAFYDQREDEEPGLGEPVIDEASEAAEPPIESLDTVEHEPPIESLDTVEHHIEEIEEGEPSTGAAAAPAEGETPGEPAEEGGEDVLEETPEFLRDAPEDDELWFEQGEPKDFDF
jgi:hypothetical protein